MIQSRRTQTELINRKSIDCIIKKIQNAITQYHK